MTFFLPDWGLLRRSRCVLIFILKSYMGGRWTETCVAPRHVDASRDFVLLFSPNEQRGGGALSDFIFCSIFPAQKTTGGIGHHREMKSSFFGLAPKIR